MRQRLLQVVEARLAPFNATKEADTVGSACLAEDHNITMDERRVRRLVSRGGLLDVGIVNFGFTWWFGCTLRGVGYVHAPVSRWPKKSSAGCRATSCVHYERT